MTEPSYKTLDELLGILNRLQAKEHFDIPQNVIDTIRFEIDKQQLDPTAHNVRKILRDQNLRKHYEHIPYILGPILNFSQFGGYNYEDSLLTNKDAIDKGLFRAESLRKFNTKENSHS
uniref:DNA-directed RNA polymerase n=1 Tax=viral metagenome TaxID=1070528 RepID=A0A6C0CCI0_9ZZZZ